MPTKRGGSKSRKKTKPPMAHLADKVRALDSRVTRLEHRKGGKHHRRRRTARGWASPALESGAVYED